MVSRQLKSGAGILTCNAFAENMICMPALPKSIAQIWNEHVKSDASTGSTIDTRKENLNQEDVQNKWALDMQEADESVSWLRLWGSLLSFPSCFPLLVIERGLVKEVLKFGDHVIIPAFKLYFS